MSNQIALYWVMGKTFFYSMHILFALSWNEMQICKKIRGGNERTNHRGTSFVGFLTVQCSSMVAALLSAELGFGNVHHTAADDIFSAARDNIWFVYHQHTHTCYCVYLVILAFNHDDCYLLELINQSMCAVCKTFQKVTACQVLTNFPHHGNAAATFSLVAWTHFAFFASGIGV